MQLLCALAYVVWLNLVFQAEHIYGLVSWNSLLKDQKFTRRHTPLRNFNYPRHDVSSPTHCLGLDSWKDFPSPQEDHERNRLISNSKYALFGISAVYGTSFGCIKLLEEVIDPGLVCALRFLIAFAVFAPHMLKVIVSNPIVILCGLEVGIYDSLGFWAQSKALETSTASTVAFLASLQVVVVPIINGWWDSLQSSYDVSILNDGRDGLSIQVQQQSKGGGQMQAHANIQQGINVLDVLIPALLAVCGSACLELGGVELPGIGDVWALLQPLLFGIAFVRLERHVLRYKLPEDVLGYTAASFLVVAVFSVIWTMHDFMWPLIQQGEGVLGVALSKQYDMLISDWRLPASLLWTGVVSTALSCYGENVALEYVDAAESTVIFSTEPLWGTAFAAVTLGETVGWNTACGAVLIIAACAYRSMSSKLVALLTAAQLGAVQGLDELGENIGANLSELLEEVASGIADIIAPLL